MAIHQSDWIGGPSCASGPGRLGPLVFLGKFLEKDKAEKIWETIGQTDKTNWKN